jgi:hypothetical protein
VARFRDVMTSFVRNYIPGGPLYAAGALKFQGVLYRQDEPLPVGAMSKARHQRLFITRKANHTPTRKVRRVVAPLVTASIDVLTESELERMTAPAGAPSSAVSLPASDSAGWRTLTPNPTASPLPESAKRSPQRKR